MPFAQRPDARIWWDQDGAGDPILLIVPAASAQRLADGIVGARLVMFPDAGHAYITDVAQAANQEVLRFLGSISGPADASSTGTRPAASTVETSG
jgi:pimeloyl-ACP methyl ester carboxylesterase